MINPIVVLFAWPFLSLTFFGALGVVRGLIVTVLVGYLILPETRVDIPILPPYDKTTAVSVGLILTFIVFSADFRKVAEDSQVGDQKFGTVFFLCFAISILVPFIVYLSNSKPLFIGPKVLQGLGPKDAISSLWTFFMLMIPYFFARRYLTSAESHRMLLKAMLVAGLVYTLFALIELRMSPQTNRLVYGFFPHDWRQHVRGGGYRPVVFLRHGLWLGFFLFSCVMAAVILSRKTEFDGRLKYILAGVWVLLVLAFSRNLGATMLGVLFLPMVFFLGKGLQVRIAGVVGIFFLLYPAIRQADVLPIDRFVASIEQISTDRARSLGTRLRNEQLFLDRVQERPVFGWGGYGRSRVHDEQGEDISIADGYWIILLGTKGWVGYIALLGLLVFPILRMRHTLKRKDVQFVTVGMTLIMAGNFVYLIPNSALSMVGLMVAGAVAGFVQFDPVPERSQRQDRRVRYSRFSGSEPGVRTRREALNQDISRNI